MTAWLGALPLKLRPDDFLFFLFLCHLIRSPYPGGAVSFNDTRVQRRAAFGASAATSCWATTPQTAGGDLSNESQQVTCKLDHLDGFGRIGDLHMTMTRRVLESPNRPSEQVAESLSLG